MRILTVFLLSIITLSVTADKVPDVEIAGIKIIRGMDKKDIEKMIPDEYTLWCAENAPGVYDDIESCAIIKKNTNTDWNAGEILFERDRVLSAQRIVGSYEDAYDGFLAFHQLLENLSEGKYDCGVVKTGNGPYQFFVALPEKSISVMIFSGKRGKGGVVLREGLRQNPTPGLNITDCWPEFDELSAQSSK